MGHMFAVDDPRMAARVRDFLAVAQDAARFRAHGVLIPLVDETESERLARAAAGETWPTGWSPRVIAASDDPVEIVGYAASRRDSGKTVGDLVATEATALSALAVALLNDDAAIELWVRGVSDQQHAALAEIGLEPARRLAVLGRRTSGDDFVALPPGVHVRSAELPRDIAGIVAVLDAAYRDTADGPWDEQRFASRTEAPWFDPADLLVAEDDDGEIVGLHWLKRRDASVGEVYNLAIHPAHHGRGLGKGLLAAGIAHLHAAGLQSVILWVDRANAPAVALYTAQGFIPYWEDVAFARQASSGPRETR